MDNRPSTEIQLSIARQYLHMVLLEQRAATEELQASNRELAAILEEFLSVRGELRPWSATIQMETVSRTRPIRLSRLRPKTWTCSNSNVRRPRS